jgi:hypothetical protein
LLAIQDKARQLMAFLPCGETLQRGRKVTVSAIGKRLWREAADSRISLRGCDNSRQFKSGARR